MSPSHYRTGFQECFKMNTWCHILTSHSHPACCERINIKLSVSVCIKTRDNIYEMFHPHCIKRQFIDSFILNREKLMWENSNFFTASEITYCWIQYAHVNSFMNRRAMKGTKWPRYHHMDTLPPYPQQNDHWIQQHDSCTHTTFQQGRGQCILNFCE